MKKNSGLGLGLSSLIPKGPIKSNVAGKDNVFYIELHKIRPNPNQPRHEFDQDSLEQLASSIKKYGILQPILVSKIAQETDRGLDVDYEVIAGERRLRAAKLAGLPQVPVIIKEHFEEDRAKLEVALIENVQRQDLNGMEEAEAYARLSAEFNLTQQEIADKVGKSREVVANTLRLLDLPQEMKSAVVKGLITRTHARALLSFKDDPRKQQVIFQQILAGNFGVKEVEEAAKEHKASRDSGKPAPSLRFEELQQNLSKNFGTAVIIKSGASGGSINIKFANLEHLNNIVKVLLD